MMDGNYVWNSLQIGNVGLVNGLRKTPASINDNNGQNLKSSFSAWKSPFQYYVSTCFVASISICFVPMSHLERWKGK